MNVGEYLSYTYTGDVRTFTAPANGTYQLEVWGAQGGTASSGFIGGTGGYSKGEVRLSKGDILYIVVGGKGVNNNNPGTINKGGYNGGGDGYTGYNNGSDYADARHCSGGGATHIAKRTGLLSELSTNKSDILIVAGGGGGSCRTGNIYVGGNGGTGGGTIGGTGDCYMSNGVDYAGTGGTQTNGGDMQGYVPNTSVASSFGKGGSATTGVGIVATAGGGGGYYGGATGWLDGAGGGGSGYIGGVENGITSNGVREGDGYVVITLLEKSISGYIGTEPFDALYIGDTEISYIVGNGS